jgi:hypothetical protein
MNSNTSTGIVAGFLVLMVVAGLVLGAMFGLPAYGRAQALLGAQNNVQVSKIEIANTQQLVQVEQQKAQVRIQEAKGLAQAQKIIDSSLTPNYLQYMAIQAQEKMAGSPSHSEIYLPCGPNGIPLVKNVGG